MNNQEFTGRVIEGEITKYQRLDTDKFLFTINGKSSKKGKKDDDTKSEEFIYHPCSLVYARGILNQNVTVTVDENNVLLGLKCID